MSPPPSFTVVVPTFNRGRSLLDTLESVRAQTVTDFEVVVVDDGSDDDPSPGIDSLGDDRFRCVRQANAGPGAARNHGASIGRGRWLVFLDDDDRADPRWLEALGAELGGGAVVAFCGLRDAASGRGRSPDAQGAAFGHHRASFIPGTFALDRSLFQELGGYCEALRWSENTELLLRVLNRCSDDGLSVASIDEPLITYGRTADRVDRIDSAKVLHAGRYLLEHHGDALGRDPEVHANYLSVAGVHASRLGRRREALRLLAAAARAQPRRAARYARVAAAAVPPVADRQWGRVPRSRSDGAGTIDVRAGAGGSAVPVALLHAFDPSALTAYRDEPRSTPLPYRVEQLGDSGIDLAFTDAMYHGIWRRAFVRACVRVAERLAAPFLQPFLMRQEIARRPVTLSMFESQANAMALARLLRIPPFRRPGFVVIACWLARDIRRFSPWRQQLYRLTYRTVDRVVYFSRNQTPILARELGLSERQLCFVPFGVDTEYFRPRPVTTTAPYVLAVGRDRERDWPTFLAAVSDLEVPVKLACRRELLDGCDVPANVEVLGMVSRAEYRDLVAGALAVVVTTHAVEYPSGQSVLLEAMSMGKCCVATATPSLADYLFDDSAVSVPLADPAALRRALERVTGDTELRERIGARARERVLEAFDSRQMWARIAAISRDLADERHVDR
jgi:glycosyltransferase involved in cell wall biosynthesis